MRNLLLGLLLGASAMAQTTFTRRIELQPSAWSASSSPEYYRGEGRQQAVDSVEDAEHGQVLRWRFGFGDAQKSEPAFLTARLEPQPPRLGVVAVRFRAKLTAPLLDPKNGFILRLRTSDTAHDNWNVQDILGKPFPVGEWVDVEVDTRPGSQVRNIWGRVFGNIREITFRLDDIDDRNGAGELLLDGIELVLSHPPEDVPYTPTITALPRRTSPRVLILRHAAAGYYRLPQAFRAVDPAIEIEEFPYRGLHFEFFGLPDTPEAFLNYDAIVLLDIDPFVLTPAQAQGIADAVASGTSLLCFGGATSLSDAKALTNPLREALPVHFTLSDSASTATVLPVPGDPHPLNQGFDPKWLGQVARRQPLIPKPGTVVPWTAGDLPLVVAGEFHQGRTVVVNAQCQSLRLGADDLFRSPLGDDFVRGLAAYALHREPESGIRSLRLGDVPVGGGSLAGTVVGGPDVRVTLDGRPVAVAADSAFSLALPMPRLTEESHLLQVEAWQDGRRIDWRDVSLTVHHPLDLQVVWTRNRFTFEPTGRIDFRLAIATGNLPTFSAALQDPRGETWVIPPIPESDGSRFSSSLPNLPPGHYRLVATAAFPNGPSVVAHADCFVVAPLPSTGFYPLMCYVDLMADGHCLDPEGITAHLRSIREAGFNTAAISSPTTLASETPSPGRDLRAFAESQAAQLGMAVTFEYSNYTTFRSNKVLASCPFTPVGQQAVHDHLAPLIDIANRTPRLLTAKVIDEPHLGPDHIDWECPHCQAEFQRRYGIPVSAIKDSQEPYALWARADFVGQVADEVFRLGAAEKSSLAQGSWELLLTYMASGLGYQSPQRSVQDALDWSRHAGWIDFDIYPYFYPTSQRIRMVQASYGMSYMREVARFRRKPWGFYVELDDRNWPFQQNPPEASAECAFTAVLHGADYLNTFIHRLATTGCGARPERWAKAREAFQRIERLGPMLAETPALRSRLAVLHPNAHEKIRNGYPRPDHLLELLKGVFGDLDVLPEQIVRESETIPYAGLILLDAEFLHEDTLVLLRKWLADGGVLYCDRLPTRTHRDQPIDWTGLGSPQTGSHGLRLRAWGKGRVAFLPENPEPVLQSLAEATSADPSALTEKLRILAEQIETTIGPMPLRISSRDLAGDGTDMDTVVAGLRGTHDLRILTVVNHRAVPVEATLRFTDRTWRYRDAIDAHQPIPDHPGELVLGLSPRGYRVLVGERRK